MKEIHKNLLLYILKCIASASAIYYLSDLLHYSEMFWCLISALLVLSPNEKEAIPLAIVRIEANVVGSCSALLCLLFTALPALVIFCLSYTLAIVACFLFGLMPASRSALVAATIVALAPVGAGHPWDKPLERVLAVTAGCLVGLASTFLFHRRLPGRGETGKVEHHGE